MATVLPTNGTSSADYLASLQQSSNPALTAPTQQMGQADFLRLLTTQMQNQDPSKPMDPTHFVTDLTQMSQLQSTNTMNKSILAMTAGFQNLQTMQAASLIGKSVQSEGQTLGYTAGTSSDIKLSAAQNLTDAKLTISDSTGVIQELKIGSINAGDKIVPWDGKGSDGNARQSGDYTLTAYGTDANGKLQTIKTIVPSKVHSVSVKADGTMQLSLATGEIVNMSAVREISQ